jgi:hypothetical protein
LTAPTQSELERDAIIGAVNQSTETAFATMLAMSVHAQPALDRPDPELLDGVVGLIGFTRAWAGTGMLFCDDHFACRIGSAMLLHECKEINSNVLDGIGEMANMILGNFKEAMESRRPAQPERADRGLRQEFFNAHAGRRALDRSAVSDRPGCISGAGHETEVGCGRRSERPSTGVTL